MNRSLVVLAKSIAYFLFSFKIIFEHIWKIETRVTFTRSLSTNSVMWSTSIALTSSQTSVTTLLVNWSTTRMIEWGFTAVFEGSQTWKLLDLQLPSRALSCICPQACRGLVTPGANSWWYVPLQSSGIEECGKYRHSKTTHPDLCHVQKAYTTKNHIKWELRKEKSCSSLLQRYATTARDLNAVNSGNKREVLYPDLGFSMLFWVSEFFFRWSVFLQFTA